MLFDGTNFSLSFRFFLLSVDDADAVDLYRDHARPFSIVCQILVGRRRRRLGALPCRLSRERARDVAGPNAMQPTFLIYGI